MNQQCKVCGEPAAGFHFGAFTCEGCKSFFGRSYNNLSSISECKNNGECVINKKNRTACKACRLRKCIMVGMSKSGSRYGRRSNWFKIHCLLQEQQQAQQQQAAAAAQRHHHLPTTGGSVPSANSPPGSSVHQNVSQLSGLSLLPPQAFQHSHLLHHLPRSKEELLLLGLDDYKASAASPSVSSPESHNSDSSIEATQNELRRAASLPLFPGLFPPHFLPPPGMLFPPGYPHIYSGLLAPAVSNNNSRLVRNHNQGVAEVFSKRVFLDAVLQSQRSPEPEREDTIVHSTPVPPHATPSPVQDDPMDLSMKGCSERGSSPITSEHSGATNLSTIEGEDDDEEDISGVSDREPELDDNDNNSERLSESEERELKRIKLIRPTPLDLTTKV